MSAGDNVTAVELALSLGTRVNTTIRTSDGSAINTVETSVDEVTIAAVAGRTYRIVSTMNLAFTVAASAWYHRIREDTGAAGNQLTYNQVNGVSTGATWPSRVEVEWTASSTGNKTFAATIIRNAGTGNATPRAAGSQPGYLYVDYIRG